MRILAIDPGPTQSAYVLFEDGRILMKGKLENAFVLVEIASLQYERLVIEMISHYGTGMPAGAEVFETCIWIGKYEREAEIRQSRAPWESSAAVYSIHRMIRREVKSHLCRSQKATDSNIRQALIDRFGGKDAAIGKKRTPGPLYGVRADEWSALAIAVTFTEQEKEKAA